MAAENINIGKILQAATKDFDRGYAIAGLIGHGDAFVIHDHGAFVQRSTI